MRTNGQFLFAHAMVCWRAGDGAAMSADELAAALAARVGPLLAQSVPGSRLRVLPKGGHLNILQEEEEAGQHPVASKPEGPATQAHSCATAEAQGAKEREPGGLGQPCCRASPARSERQENLPGSRAGADGGRPSTGNRGPEAGPGPQTQRSAARCPADPPAHGVAPHCPVPTTSVFHALLVVGVHCLLWATERVLGV